MATLAELQQGFFRAIVDGEPAAFAGHVRSGRLAGVDRLETYSRSVAANWREALADTYPVIERLVGPAFFGEAARQYARAHPSTSGDLHRFGDAFAAFLASYPHARALPYLPDVARLEWAWHESFHAADACMLDLEALARVPGDTYEAIRFRLHPAVRLVQSAFPIATIWEANQEGRDGTVEGECPGERVLVHRPEFEVRLERLTDAEWRLLASLERGASLGSAAESLGEEDAVRLAPLLRRFVEQRIIAGFAA